MSRCLSNTSHGNNDGIIVAWQADIAFPRSTSTSNQPSPYRPLKRHRHPLGNITPNMSQVPRKTRRTKEDDPGQEKTPRARTRRGGNQESPTRIGPQRMQQQSQQVDNESAIELSGVLELGEAPSLPFHSSRYAAALSLSEKPPAASEPSSTSRSRASSPIKKKADLKLGKVALDYKGVTHVADVLPEDVRSLFKKLRKISRGWEIIPQNVQALIEEADRDELLPHMIDDSQRDPANILEEFKTIEKILKRSHDCLLREKHEPAWNEEVHKPMLDLILEGQKDVSVDNVTLAQIAPEFVPLLASERKVNMQSKMVDYTINLVLPPATLDHVRKFFASSSSYNEHSLNQTIYAAVRDRPVAISLETKIDNPNDPTTQLAIWTAAWHNRIRAIVPGAMVVTLPLVTVGKDGWKISFFCDCAGRVEIWEFPETLGHTKTRVGIYMLRSSLLTLKEWVLNVYKPWFDDVVLPVIQEIATST